MNPTRRSILAFAAAAALAATPAMAQQRDPGVSGPVSGTIFLSAQGAAAGVGYTWGDGVLRYGGRSHHFTVSGVTALNDGTTPRTVRVRAERDGAAAVEFDAVVRIDTPGEADYYRHGGIMQYVLRSLL